MLKHHQREQIIWDSLLPKNETFLLLAINSFVDGNGECWPGQELLARMCRMTDRTVRTLCNSLEEKRIIQRTKRFSNNGYRTSDKFKISFDEIKSYQPPEKFSGKQEAQTSSSKPPEKTTTGKNNHRKKQPPEKTTTGNSEQDYRKKRAETTGKNEQNLVHEISGELIHGTNPLEQSNNQDPPIVPQGDAPTSEAIPVEILSEDSEQQLGLLESEQSDIPDRQNEDAKGSGEKQKGKSPGSGKKRKSKSDDLPQVASEQIDQAKAVYNERKPNAWAEAESMGDERVKMLRKALKAANGDWNLVIDRMVRGLSMARLLPWWSGTKEGDCYDNGSFESTFRNRMYIQWAEKLTTQGLDPDKMLASGMNDLQLQQAHQQFKKKSQKEVKKQSSSYERYKAAKAAKEAERRELKAC